PAEVDKELTRDGEEPSSGFAAIFRTHVPVRPQGRLAMSIDEIKKRFVNEIKLRAYDDKYIDKTEEREILQIAIQLGVSIDSGRGALIQVCDEHSYVMETVVLKQIKDQVETAAGNDGMVDQ